MRFEYDQTYMKSNKTEQGTSIGLNEAPRRNTFVFGILLILMQIAICFIYGFLVRLPPQQTLAVFSFSSVAITVILFFMVVIGFGPLFAYNRKLVWSALGFNLLIVCLTIEWFFLIYLFWFKTNIRGQGIGFSSGTKYNNIWLTNNIVLNVDSSIVSAMGGCLTQALKCAIANCVAFSAILGRAGPLEAFWVALFGTIGFELNRAVVEYVYFDYGGTYTVFTYGGFMSLLVGLLLRFKETNNQEKTASTENNPRYTGNLYSVSISFIGAAILFAVFPIITADPETPWIVNGVTVNTFNEVKSTNLSILYNVPISIWYCMSSSVIVGMAFSTFIHEKVVARDLLHSLVAGGVAAASSSVYFTNPVWPMILGCATGIVQGLVQGIIEKKVAVSGRVFNTISFTMFGVQGIIGGIFGSIFRRVIQTRTDNIVFNLTINNKPAGYDLGAALISAGFGIGFGILTGIFVLITSKHTSDQYFDDYTYWEVDDGIRYTYAVAPTPPVVVTEAPIIQSQIYVKEASSNVKSKHAYL